MIEHFVFRSVLRDMQAISWSRRALALGLTVFSCVQVAPTWAESPPTSMDLIVRDLETWRDEINGLTETVSRIRSTPVSSVTSSSRSLPRRARTPLVSGEHFSISLTTTAIPLPGLPRSRVRWTPRPSS